MSDSLAAVDAAPVVVDVPAPVVEIDVDGAADLGDGAALPAATSDEASAQGDAGGTSVRDFILKGLAEIDGSSPAAPDTAADAADAAHASDADHPDETEVKVPDAPTQPAKATEEHPESIKDSDDGEKPAAEEAKADEEAAEAPKFAKVIPETNFKSRAEIDADFDRVPKEARAVMAEYAEAGMAMKSTLESLGGDAYIAPLTKIAGGMQEGDNLPIFAGVLEAVGVDDFATFADDTLRFVMIEALADDKPTSDAGAYLQARLKESTEGAIKAMFGNDVDLAYVRKLVKYDQAGHLNTRDVDKYFEENGDDDIAVSPVIAEKDARIKELEAKVQEQEGAETADQQAAQARQTRDFETGLVKATNTLLNDLVIKRSALKALATDTPEIAAGKETMRDLLKAKFDASIKGNPLFSKLRDSALKGEISTANYQKRYSTLTDAAIMQARASAAPLETVLALLYGNTQNGKILGREGEKAANGGPTGAPTITAEATKPDGMTMEQWRQHMTTVLTDS